MFFNQNTAYTERTVSRHRIKQYFDFVRKFGYLGDKMPLRGVAVDRVLAKIRNASRKLK